MGACAEWDGVWWCADSVVASNHLTSSLPPLLHTPLHCPPSIPVAGQFVATDPRSSIMTMSGFIEVPYDLTELAHDSFEAQAALLPVSGRSGSAWQP